MTTSDSEPDEVEGIRTVIRAFLQERFEAKAAALNRNDADYATKYQALVDRFDWDNWIEDATRRVSQIQLVTHSLKAIHPDAKGTNLYAPPRTLPEWAVVGTHCLGEAFDVDVVGNAAALDVYKFLSLEVGGRTLLDRVLDNDQTLGRALSDDDAQGRRWLAAFAGITDPSSEQASHTYAKQLYFLVGDDPTRDADFHLLAPLYATSLAHRVFRTISEDRFGEKAREARQAYRDDSPHDQGFREYPELAVQKLGGTKPQNISQLNSERGGNNYLLASLPPVWQSRSIKAPLGPETVFGTRGVFARRREVVRTVTELRRFLAREPPANLHTRRYVAERLSELCTELVQFAAELRELEPGWSRSSECRLDESEALWLDPSAEGGEEDRFSRWLAMDGPASIRRKFANWLNGELRGALPSVGDPEHRHWAASLGSDADWTRSLDDLEEDLRDA